MTLLCFIIHFLFFYLFCLSVCMSLCVCVWAMLPDSNKMMTMMKSSDQGQHYKTVTKDLKPLISIRRPISSDHVLRWKPGQWANGQDQVLIIAELKCLQNQELQRSDMNQWLKTICLKRRQDLQVIFCDRAQNSFESFIQDQDPFQERETLR